MSSSPPGYEARRPPWRHGLPGVFAIPALEILAGWRTRVAAFAVVAGFPFHHIPAQGRAALA